MFSTAFRMLNDYDAANDALQDAFVEVFGSLGNFRQGAGIKIIVAGCSKLANCLP
jgi:DNA-directed RNA polymerase specialized sigma24 family protein